MQFTKIPTNTFKELQLNAGVLLTSFEPSTGTVTAANIIGATTGGIKFADTPSYIDMGDDIDNCPKNTKELKKYDSREVKLSGTYVSVNSTLVKSLMGSATVTSSSGKITPSDTLSSSDFTDIWWVGDYSDNDGGFVAIHLMNALNTGGFQVQSTDKGKGNFAFEYTAHYSNTAQDTVPYEVYVKAGTASV